MATVFSFSQSYCRVSSEYFCWKVQRNQFLATRNVELVTSPVCNMVFSGITRDSWLMLVHEDEDQVFRCKAKMLSS